MKITKKIQKLVKRECERSPLGRTYALDAYYDHILPVRNFALKLAKIYHADKEVVELATLLHDLSFIRTGDHKIHEITVAELAAELLKKMNYPEEKIQEVKACLLTHRGSKKRKRKSIEQKIVAAADAMEHIDDMAYMFYRVSKEQNFNSALKWTFDKLERSWKKIELSEGRKFVRKKYLAARNFFKSFKKKKELR